MTTAPLPLLLPPLQVPLLQPSAVVKKPTVCNASQYQGHVTSIRSQEHHHHTAGWPDGPAFIILESGVAGRLLAGPIQSGQRIVAQRTR